MARHQFTTEECRLSGLATSRDRAHMSAIGRLGGRAKARANAAQCRANGNIWRCSCPACVARQQAIARGDVR